MAVEHSTLTDPYLHEPKGIAAANAGEAYIADGLGSGDWTDISPYNAFSADFLHVRHEESSGTPASGSTGSYVQRTINTTKTNSITGASVGSNAISLPAGTYHIQAVVPIGAGSGVGKSAVYNATTANNILIGTSGTSAFESFLNGRFTLAGTSSIQIRSFSPSGGSWGQTASIGDVEVYLDVMIWKVG